MSLFTEKVFQPLWLWRILKNVHFPLSYSSPHPPHTSSLWHRSCFDIHKAQKAKTHPEPPAGPSSRAQGTGAPVWEHAGLLGTGLLPELIQQQDLMKVQSPSWSRCKYAGLRVESPTSYGLRLPLNSLLGLPHPRGKSPGKCHKSERPRR